ncbi:nucleotide exchange factor GrpE [Prevotella sp.]|uniref:nucleotide exchange factor GrpE n=1 Tax=Prevotella sp. TaxID=59823 RepID=UPI002649268C|nr:nucleotide exchange factor GrpE [Prevotella sp.]MDN5553617.1 nucleotide exchange factor GrpE [Prevotella sp.]
MAKQENSVNTENLDKETLDGNAACNTQTDNDTAKETDKNADCAEDNDKEEDTETAEEKDPVELLKEENAKLKDQLLRTIAEFDNFRKRTAKEKSELVLNGGKRVIKEILTVVDDLERAAMDKSEDPTAIKEGVKMIDNKFIKTLESLGVKKIETEDADFNTDFHEAIAMVPGMGDDKKGKVIDCVQSGYTMNDEVIRHAKVAVGQ